MLRSSLLAAVMTVGFVSAAAAAVINFHATLSSAQEVPPKTSAGSGDMLGTLNTQSGEFTYTVTFSGLTGAATMAHFHGPAKAGANAGVVIPLGNNPTSPIHGSHKLTDAQMKQLESGLWYVNVHTAANPGGEIRGQVMETKK
jgi:hypothetical protein